MPDDVHAAEGESLIPSLIPVAASLREANDHKSKHLRRPQGDGYKFWRACNFISPGCVFALTRLRFFEAANNS